LGWIDILRKDLKTLSTHVLRIVTPMLLVHPAVFEIVKLRFSLDQNMRLFYYEAQMIDKFIEDPDLDQKLHKILFSYSIEI
jgi:hypothetical protein